MVKTSAFSINVHYLHNHVLPFNKDFETNLKANVYNYYKRWIFKPVYDHRIEYIEKLNKKTSINRRLAPIEPEEEQIKSVYQYQQNFAE